LNLSRSRLSNWQLEAKQSSGAILGHFASLVERAPLSKFAIFATDWKGVANEVFNPFQIGQ
jgi:hypothetical protein